MRIAYLYPSLAVWGGIERILVDKMNYWVRHYGYEVYMVTSDQGSHSIPYDLEERVHFVDLDIRFHTRFRFKRIRRITEYHKMSKLYQERLHKFLQDIKPDVIVCTTSHNVKQLLKLKGHTPLVVESHVNFSHPDTFVQRMRTLYNNYWVGKAETVVALTYGDAKKWRRVGRNVCVIPNVVSLNDTGQYSKCNSRQVLFVGRFTEQKGIGDLFAIWQQVHSKFPDWQLDLYGDGELWEKYEQEAKTLNQNIVLHKPTSRIFDVYRNSSILVLPSVYEPFGLVMPEAMSCGLPVVAFDCPYGPASIITDGEDGFLISNRDQQRFVDKLCILMGNQELRQRMGRKAIVSSLRFAPSIIMPMWKGLFEQLVPLP